MKLSALQDPNMKMCTLVRYPGSLSFTPVILLWSAHLHIRILQCTKFHELLINHVGEFVMTKCILICPKRHKRDKTQWTIKSVILQSSHVLPLLCFFELRYFVTIQCALCHRKFSYMINQKFMKLSALQDPNMKMCTLVRYPSPLSFTPVMPLWT
jgi:hypothetical protein